MTIDQHVKTTIELVYDRDCPNVENCRAALRSALVELGVLVGVSVPQTWREWDRNALDTPAAYRSLGSPSILVDGLDIYAPRAGDAPEGNSCRLYANDESGGLCGTPSVKTIVTALTVDAAPDCSDAVTQAAAHSSVVR